MESTNPFDLFTAESRPAPDLPDDHRNRPTSTHSFTQFHSTLSYPSSVAEDLRLTASEVSSYKRDFGSEITLPGHNFNPSLTTSSQTTVPGANTFDRETTTTSLLMEHINSNFARSSKKLDALISAISSLVTKMKVSNLPPSQPIENMSNTGLSPLSPPQIHKMKTM
jgi:hypothetical protein